MAVRDFSAHGTTRVAKVAEGAKVCVVHVRGRKTGERIRTHIRIKRAPRKRQSCQSGRGGGSLCFARAGAQDWGGANPKRRSEDSKGWRSLLLAEI